MSRRRGDRWRFRLLQYAVALVGLLLAARVIHIQVFQHERLRGRADDLWTRQVEISAERGNLYDRSGRPLALSVSAWRVGVAGRLVDDPVVLAGILGEVLERDPKQLARRIERAAAKGQHLVLASQAVLSREGKRRLNAEPAVTLDDLRARVYPYDGVAASLVGFYRYDDKGDVATGLELGLSEHLAGRSGLAQEIESALKGRKMGRITLEEARHGHSLTLSLDVELQAICERRLAASVKACGALGGSVLVLDPHSGDILAAASWPLLPDRDGRQSDAAVWNNRNFTQYYEPGSVFKIFTTASLLRNGAVDTATVYDCTNGDFGSFTIRNSDGHSYGDLSLLRAFSRSSNIYFARAVGNLSAQELYRDLVDFGFGQATALPYPGLVDGLLASPADWSGRSKPTIAIGQEVAVTPLQLGLALCAVANDGILYAPRMVREIRDENGHLLEQVPPVPLREVLAQPLAELLREAMRRVVDEGTGQATHLDWVATGGKTGTAQKCIDGLGYEPNAYVASFGGIVPVDEPELVILTILDEPRGVHHYASQSAAPLFAEIVKDIRLSTDWLLDVPGANTVKVQAETDDDVVVPDVLYLSADRARQQIRGRRLKVAGDERNGVVIQQVPAPGTHCRPDQLVTLTVSGKTDPAAAAATICPDFTGLSNRQIRSLAARLGLDVSLSGVGYAQRQQPSAGRPLVSGVIAVTLGGL